MTLRPGDRPRVRVAIFVSDNFFSVLGVPLPIGPGFHADEVSDGTPSRVVILTDAVSRADFDSDPSIVGSAIRIGVTDFTVVGVAPQSFSGLHPVVREAVCLPMGLLPVLVDAHPSNLGWRRNTCRVQCATYLVPGATCDVLVRRARC